ncbi:MAG: hypothetical protein E7647_01465 [Ruminococcaceae bacterium]|nr:hypothetical protein [Oscillospiraceae bacterium]
MKSVALNEGISSIKSYAFADCTSLLSIYIPSSLAYIDERTFSGCTSLNNVTIAEGITSIKSCAFISCKNLTSITIPSSVNSIESYAFQYCDNLKSVTLNEGLNSIGYEAFSSCDSLSSVSIPASVNSIGSYAFEYCDNLKSITFRGEAPTISSNAFKNVTAIVYYPSNNLYWTDDVMNDYGGNLTWLSYSGNASERTFYSVTYPDNTEESGISLMSVYPGDSTIQDNEDNEIGEDHIISTSSFDRLVPGKSYILLVLADMNVDDTLSYENLLYIAQGTASEDGTLTFRYSKKEEADLVYVMACGPSNKDLSNAEIVFPDMEATGEKEAVCPTVSYDGTVLTEGVDYIILGSVDYATAGIYTCFIRGIYDYTGIVTCTYTVKGDFVLGDIDGDGILTAMDSNLLKRIIANILSSIPPSADVNGDGAINAIDSNLLKRTIAGQ